MSFITSSAIGNYPQIRFMKEFLIGHPGFIAGGCFKSAFLGSKPHDVDMFLPGMTEFTDAVRYFSENQEEYERGYQNRNVESFIHKKSGIRIECVKKVFGTPDKILSGFDFTITKFALYVEAEPPEDEDDSWHYTDWVMYHPDYFEHLHMKRLVVDDQMRYPVSTFHRTYKYAASGFLPCRETKLKLIRALRDLPEVKDEDLANSFYEGVD